MPGNSFGHIFRITTFGESHGSGVGVILDGCPAGLEITKDEIQHELNRRRPGTSHLTSTRQEKDEIVILSGIYENKTLGTPIAMFVYNKAYISKVYEPIKDLYRPGHADFSYDAKYGFRDWRGGGRASARETVGRVAAGAVAKKLLSASGIRIFGYVTQIGKVKIGQIDETVIEKNPLHCPDEKVLNKMIKEIETARRNLDSIGGIVEVVAKNVPAGLGEPVFNKLSADLAQAIVSIPAVKGFEIGDGFACASKCGSENNDIWVKKGGRIGTATNRAGGIIGGISTGEDIVIRCAFKPTPSIARKQKTVNTKGEESEIAVFGRHDPCVCSRAVPIVEAMMAITIADHFLLNKISKI